MNIQDASADGSPAIAPALMALAIGAGKLSREQW
jgi:hypothetical protein